MSETQQVIIVDISEERVADLTAAFSDDVEVMQLSEWMEASILLEVVRAPELIVLSYEGIATTGPDAMWAADSQLGALDVPTLILFNAESESYIKMYKGATKFNDFLRWPVQPHHLSVCLNNLATGIARHVDPPAPVTIERPKLLAEDDFSLDLSMLELPDEEEIPLISDEDFEFSNPVEIPEIEEALHSGEISTTSWMDLQPKAPTHKKSVLTMPSLSSGQLADVPVPRLLYLLAKQRRTGRLRLRKGGLNYDAMMHQGRLVQDGTTDRVLDNIQAAFAWNDGFFEFQWCPVGPAETVAMLTFIHDGLKALSMNDILGHLSGNEGKYPVFTTLFVSRARQLSELAGVHQVLEQCDGKKNLNRMMSEAGVSIDVLSVALALGLSTDCILFVPSPTRSPVGVSYKLAQHEVTGTIKHSSAMRAESSIFKVVKRPKTGIENVAAGDLMLLADLENELEKIIEADPHDVFNLIPGCGRFRVEIAYAEMLRARARISAEMAPAIHITAELRDAAMRDAYLLALETEREQEDDTASSQMSAAEAALFEELELRLGDLGSRDPYDMFGIWKGCGQEKVKEAFDEQRRRYRPERYEDYHQPEIRHVATLVYGALIDAFERLLGLEKVAPDVPEPKVKPKETEISLSSALEGMVYAEQLRQIPVGTKTNIEAPGPNKPTAAFLKPRSSRRRASKPSGQFTSVAVGSGNTSQLGSKSASTERSPKGSALGSTDPATRSRSANRSAGSPNAPTKSVSHNETSQRPERPSHAALQTAQRAPSRRRSQSHDSSGGSPGSSQTSRQATSVPSQPEPVSPVAAGATHPTSGGHVTQREKAREEKRARRSPRQAPGLKTVDVPVPTPSQPRESVSSSAPRMGDPGASSAPFAPRMTDPNASQAPFAPRTKKVSEHRLVRAQKEDSIAEMDAATAFKYGKDRLERKSLNRALEAFERAAAQDKENGKFAAFVAWTSFLLYPDTGAETKKELKRTIRMENGAEMGAFFMGTMLLQEDDIDNALRYLNLANRANPDNPEIERALRLVNMRKSEQAPKGSLLNRLLGK